MSLKMVPKKVQQATPGKKKKTSKDWDSTNQNLSQMTLSPSERRLKKDVQARYSKVHRSRPSSTVSTPTSASKNTKTVSWEDWKLKPEVDFEQELAHALPGLGMSPNLAVVASPRVRVSKSTTASAVSSPKAGPLPSKAALRRKPPVVNKNSQSLKWDAVSGAESNCLHSALEQLALNDGLGTIMEGMTHLNHVLCLQNGDINDESELEMHRWSVSNWMRPFWNCSLLPLTGLEFSKDEAMD